MLQLLSSFLYDANRFNLLGQPSINSNALMYNDYDAMKGWQCFDVQDRLHSGDVYTLQLF